MRPGKGWDVRASDMSVNTFNPIRSLLETLQLNPNPDKQMIALSIGDPTVFGNLRPCETTVNAVADSLKSGLCNGYQPSTGSVEAREAVAGYVSTDSSQLTALDVIICSGCSMALDMCISVLANPGDSILVPKPGFPLYQTLANGLGIRTVHYNLDPDCDWEADLEQLESLIDDTTRAIVVNNPSNPCGSVFSEFHLRHILQVAARNRVPIIADEIYDHFVFPGQSFQYIAALSDDVPILSCGGLTKRHLVPGWRLGWITIHDRHGAFTQVRRGLNSLSQRIIGSNTIVQGALKTILSETPDEFFASTLRHIHENAKLAYGMLSRIAGLKPVMPQGAMYMMVGIEMSRFPEFPSDLHLVEAVVTEQSVFPLPGKCFNYPDYVRMVLTVPRDQMLEACRRIAEFCAVHYRSEETVDQCCTPDAVDQCCTPDAVDQCCTPDAVDQCCTPDAVDQCCPPDAVDQRCTPDAVDQCCTSNAVDQRCTPDAVDQRCTPDAVDQRCTPDAVDQCCTKSSCELISAELVRLEMASGESLRV